MTEPSDVTHAPKVTPIHPLSLPLPPRMSRNIVPIYGVPDGASLSAHLYHSSWSQRLMCPLRFVSRQTAGYCQSGQSPQGNNILQVMWCLVAETWRQSRLSDLSRQCDSLLSMVKEYSPRLVGTPAAIEADAIERCARPLCCCLGHLSNESSQCRRTYPEASVDLGTAKRYGSFHEAERDSSWHR